MINNQQPFDFRETAAGVTLSKHDLTGVIFPTHYSSSMRLRGCDLSARYRPMMGLKVR